jgi:hypothetical protein
MLKRVFPLLLAALLVAIPTGNLLAAANKAIALTMKVTGEVQIKKSGTDKKEALKFGSTLDDGDWIKTGDNGIVTIIFSDDKSLITLQPRTEVTISGKRDQQSNIAKKVSMEVGQLFAKVEKQRGTLDIATPTSVASVKGTEFWVVVFPDGTTEVVTLEGLVELMNTISHQAVNVGQGETGHSDGEGNNNVNPTPPDGVPQGEQGAAPKTVEIQLVDPEGHTKTVIIQYIEGQ